MTGNVREVRYVRLALGEVCVGLMKSGVGEMECGGVTEVREV